MNICKPGPSFVVGARKRLFSVQLQASRCLGWRDVAEIEYKKAVIPSKSDVLRAIFCAQGLARLPKMKTSRDPAVRTSPNS
jgi:hypothetical protein